MGLIIILMLNKLKYKTDMELKYIEIAEIHEKKL